MSTSIWFAVLAIASVLLKDDGQCQQIDSLTHEPGMAEPYDSAEVSYSPFTGRIEQIGMALHGQGHED
jgi:hypothetical protein